MLKRKKSSHSPSSSPPKGTSDHSGSSSSRKKDKNKNKIISNNNNIGNNNNSNNNNNNNNITTINNINQNGIGDNNGNNSKISNPKKYQKPNSSNPNNELVDHHHHIPSNVLNDHQTINNITINKNEPIVNNEITSTINNNKINNNNIIESTISSSPNISKVICISQPSPPIEKKLPIKDIYLQDSPLSSYLQPKNNTTSSPLLPSTLLPPTTTTSISTSTTPSTSSTSSIYVPKFKAQNQPVKPLSSLSDNSDFIPITSNSNSKNNNSDNNNQNSNNNNSKSYNSKVLVPVWLEGSVKNKHLADLKLDREIEYFVDWVSPTTIENRLRQKLIKEVEVIIRGIWPKSRIIVFGSFVNDLSLPSSDIDIQVSEISDSNVNNSNYYDHDPIKDLHSTLIRKYQDTFTNCRLILGAKVPIIKMTSLHTHYNIDICFNTPNGIENTLMIKTLLNRYKCMRTLLIVIKFFLFQNSLNETYTGGIGSYALALMVVSYIQLRNVPLNMRTNGIRGYKDAGNDTDYGKMLKEFFELYGRSFNYSLLGISLEQGGIYFNKDEQWGTSLMLIDPHDRENDVGKNSFNIPFIRGTFTNSLVKLVSNDVLKEKYSNITFTSKLTRIIEERLVEQLAKERAQVIKYGISLEEAGELPEIVPIEELINNPPQLKANRSKVTTTLISLSSEESGNESTNLVILDSDSSDIDVGGDSQRDYNDSDCVIISESDSSSDDVNSNKSMPSRPSSYSNEFSDYSSDDSEMESMIESTNSTSPNSNHSNFSPLSSDNEDNINTTQIKQQNQSSSSSKQNQTPDPFAW